MRLFDAAISITASTKAFGRVAVDNIFDWMGVHPQDLIAGFAGGVSNIIVFQRVGPWAGSIILGVLASGWLLDLVMYTFNLSERLRGPFGFIVGLCAMVICQGLVAAVKKWNLLQTKGNP